MLLRTAGPTPGLQQWQRPSGCCWGSAWRWRPTCPQTTGCTRSVLWFCEKATAQTWEPPYSFDYGHQAQRQPSCFCNTSQHIKLFFPTQTKTNWQKLCENINHVQSGRCLDALIYCTYPLGWRITTLCVGHVKQLWHPSIWSEVSSLVLAVRKGNLTATVHNNILVMVCQLSGEGLFLSQP